MSPFDSDQDHRDYYHGEAYGRGVLRLCAECGREFWQSTEEPFTLTVLCDQCCAIRDERARTLKSEAR